MYNDDEYMDLPLPKPDGVAFNHPFKNKTNHDRLLRYVQKRLVRGKQVRDARLRRMVDIDRHIAGWIRHDEEDQARIQEQRRTGIPQAVKVNLPLTFVHLDDMMTYFIQTFAPSRGMFYHTGGPTDQGPAQQITTLMNNHAQYSGYYREVAKTLWAIMKYNQGGLYVSWGKDTGPKLTPGSDGAAVLSEAEVWQGNRNENLDNYNTFWDPAVNPIDCYKDGEFCARTMVRSHYWMLSRAARGMYYNCEDLIKDCTETSQYTYYRNPPAEARMLPESNGGTDWVAVLAETPEYMKGVGFELTEIFIRCNPYQLNLVPQNADNKSKRNRPEIWRISILNNQNIVDITYMNNMHGYLPMFSGTIKEDAMGSAVKSPAEVLKPLQDFASFLMNAHIMASRKNIYGLTVYDPSMIDMDQIPEGEVAVRVPLKASGYGKDVRMALWKDSGELNTDQTMVSLSKVMDLVNQFFPTQSLPSQIAGIDRAIDSQVAAVQQGTNRRNQKDARIIDDTLMRPMRFAMYYNIVQYQPDNTSVQDYYGKTIQIDLDALRASDLPFIIGQGLKAIDMQAAAGKLQQVIFALIQNPQAAGQIDLLGLIDYWTSLIDIDVDMTKFHLAPPQPNGQPSVGPDGQPIAGAPVVPITNANAVTAPLTKPGVAAPAGGAAA